MTGWAVEVKYQYTDGAWGISQVWHASVADKAEAEKRVRETASVGDDVAVVAIGEISDTVLEGLKLPPDQARQWV